MVGAVINTVDLLHAREKLTLEADWGNLEDDVPDEEHKLRNSAAALEFGLGVLTQSDSFLHVGTIVATSLLVHVKHGIVLATIC